MPKWLGTPKLLDMLTSPVAELIEGAASLDPVEFSGLSTSIDSEGPELLLLRLCLFDGAEGFTLRGKEAAPGPGAFLGGAAAMGTTPLPPTAPVVDPV